MDDKSLLQVLRRLQVETGSLACMGCGYEHNCGVHGCAIIRDAVERLSAREDDRGMLIGNFIVVQEGTNQRKGMSDAKRALAQQAGAAVEQAMMENNLYIRGQAAIGWKVKIYCEKGGS